MFYKIIATGSTLGFNVSNAKLQDENQLDIYMMLSEASPVVQTGGLGEVGEGLPVELANLGHRVHCCLPKYTGVLEDVMQKGFRPFFKADEQNSSSKIYVKQHAYQSAVFRFWMDTKERLSYDLVGTNCYSVFDNRTYRNIYNYTDTAMQFMLFDRIAVSRIKPKENTIVHGHDWQAGHVHTELKTRYLWMNIPSLHTIHNLKYRNTVSQDEFYKITGLKEADYPQLYSEKGIKYPGEDKADPTWAALSIADQVNTVSKNYVSETMNECGEGFEHLLKIRFQQNRYTGIVNGVGENWYPEFSADNFKDIKPKYKAMVQRAFGLPEDPNALLIMMAARFDAQKGYDLVKEILLKLHYEHNLNFQFVVNSAATDDDGNRILGDFRYLEQHALANKVKIIEPFNPELTHHIYAGADISLVPSKFEPCGLVAPCSMVNGTIPIGRAVGGMVDIIKDGKNGFLVKGDWSSLNNDSRFIHLRDGFIGKILEVNAMMRHRETDFNPFVASMMQENHSWGPPAKEYVELYREVIARFKREGHYRAFGIFN